MQSMLFNNSNVIDIYVAMATDVRKLQCLKYIDLGKTALIILITDML